MKARWLFVILTRSSRTSVSARCGSVVATPPATAPRKRICFRVAVPAVSADRRTTSLATRSSWTRPAVRSSRREVDTLGRFFNSFDGLSRRQRIRYDTPTIAGFKVGASAIDAQSWDVAMHYKGKVAGVKIAAGAAFTHWRGQSRADRSQQDFNQLNGSISVLTPFGLGATFSGGKQWIDYQCGCAGRAFAVQYQSGDLLHRKWTELGPTGIEYAYQFSNDISAVGDEGQGHSVMLTQVLANTGTDTFATFRYYDVERDGPIRRTSGTSAPASGPASSRGLI